MVENALQCTLTVSNTIYRVKITTGSANLFSEVGNVLSSRDDCDIAAMWKYDLLNNEWNVSLRSTLDIDVARIAQIYGGGGHKHAAGFRIDGEKGNLRTVFTF
jgi:nanoRNase/pAp phosphatase (c-di-AMP/oligoRNAs hydrolase)